MGQNQSGVIWPLQSALPLSYCCVFHHTASASLFWQPPLPIRPGWSLLPGLSAALQFQSRQATSVHSLTARLFYTPMSDFTALFFRQNSRFRLSAPTTTCSHLHLSKHYSLLSLTTTFACKLCGSRQNFQTFRTLLIHETYKTFHFLQTFLTHIVRFPQTFCCCCYRGRFLCSSGNVSLLILCLQ